MQLNNDNNQVIEKTMLSSVPVLKNIINWTPSISNNVPKPNGFDKNMKNKLFAIKQMTLPNSLLPLFVPEILQTNQFYNPSGANGSVFNPTFSPNTLNYWWLFRNRTTNVVYGNYLYWQNNYGITQPSTQPNNINSILTPYYKGFNFVNDFLQLIYTQVNNSIGSSNWNIGMTFNIGYIQQTNDIYIQMDSTFYSNYSFEISPTLAYYLNYNTTSNNTVIFNPPLNGLVSAYSILNWTRITPYKAIYLISHNTEFQYVSFQTNTTVSSLVPTNSVGTSQTAIYWFTNSNNNGSNSSPFILNIDDPKNSGIRFKSDTFNSDVLRFSVKLQLKDNITFIDYPFAANETVDLYTYLYEEQYSII